MSNAVLFRLRESNALVCIVEDKTADAWLCSHVAIIRYWGTTKGFSELCAGPTGKTILDVADLAALAPGALAEVSRGQVIYSLPANEKRWREVLNVGR